MTDSDSSKLTRELTSARAKQFIKQINRPISVGTKQKGRSSVSLFSGLLGLEIGLSRAGFKCHLALDKDPDAKKVIESNRQSLGNVPYVLADIDDYQPESILQRTGLNPGDTTVLAGGPPCQPFSKSGLRKGVTDDRGELFRRYLHYVHVLQPEVFILENVRGLYSSRGGKDFKLILECFDNTGYTVYWNILDAANYGVPQFRQRLFFVGFRNRLQFSWPEHSHGAIDSIDFFDRLTPFVTSEEALSNLDGTRGPAYTGQYKDLLTEIPEGLNYSFFTEKRGHPNPRFEWRSKFWYFLLKLARQRPSLTIQAYPGNNTGPFHWENRRLSIEELRRLQTFPDWLTIQTSYTTAHRLLGNAVPPVLSEAIGRSILEALTANVVVSQLEHQRIRTHSQNKNARVKSGHGSGKGPLQSTGYS